MVRRGRRHRHVLEVRECDGNTDTLVCIGCPKEIRGPCASKGGMA